MKFMLLSQNKRKSLMKGTFLVPSRIGLTPYRSTPTCHGIQHLLLRLQQSFYHHIYKDASIWTKLMILPPNTLSKQGSCHSQHNTTQQYQNFFGSVFQFLKFSNTNRTQIKPNKKKKL